MSTAVVKPWRLSEAHRELFMNLLRREIRGRYKGSLLGVAWTLVMPLIMMASYYLVFSTLWQVTNIPNFAIYMLTGLALWTFLGGALVVASTSLISNGDLIKKVRFPRVMVPIASAASQLITMLVIVLAIVPFSLILMRGDRRYMLLTPVVVLLTIAMVVGLSLMVSVFNVYFRDLEYILSALLLPWFFLTPIIYQFSGMPFFNSHPAALTIMKFCNFVTPYVLALQDVLYRGVMPSARLWVYMVVVSSTLLVAGYAIFRRLQRDLAVEL